MPGDGKYCAGICVRLSFFSSVNTFCNTLLSEPGDLMSQRRVFLSHCATFPCSMFSAIELEPVSFCGKFS